MTRFDFKIIFIHKQALKYPLTARILARLQVPTEIIDDSLVIREEIEKSPDPIAAGKKILYLAQQKGKFIKPCPCTPRMIRCGYLIINSILGCPIDCSYCILQAYLDDPWITIFVDEDKLENSLRPLLKASLPAGLRIGPGELTDSLALEPYTRQAERLAQLFYRSSRTILELKTKTTNIDSWLDWPPSPNIVFSWSLNAETIAKEEEKGAPPVGERIRAAAQLAIRGHQVGFHFDPLIYFEGWEREYEKVIKELFALIPSKLIRWISLGALRYPLNFRKIILLRFRHKAIFASEMIIGRDGKFRYFKPLRIKLYTRIYEMIRDYGGENLPLYLCMEDEEVWELILKKKPERRKDLFLLFSPPVNN
ncbi:MAG: hypothetical protein N3B16_01225 [Candidatus Aminicenantes bacterium]|nr:hypothetical protein [Candidatus Aminicenantes bacterium]